MAPPQGPPHLGGQQPPVLGEVEDGLHHAVSIQQVEDVPNTRLLPERLAQAPARLLMLHGRWAPQQHPRVGGHRGDDGGDHCRQLCWAVTCQV